jgi:hypothetical protein
MALKALRTPLNLSYIYSDEEKRTAVMTAAEVLTPGPAAVATQLVLATTWAYAESDNDVELLWKGYKVPIVKDKTSWATDLDKALEGIGDGTIIPSVDKGYDYSQYLSVLLYFQNDNIKIARTLDLIQINMRKNYDEGFLIGEHSVGVNIDVTVDGKRYSYDKKY